MQPNAAENVTNAAQRKIPRIHKLLGFEQAREWHPGSLLGIRDIRYNRTQPTQVTSGFLRGMGGAGPRGTPTMMGATGTQADGRRNNALPAGVPR